MGLRRSGNNRWFGETQSSVPKAAASSSNRPLWGGLLTADELGLKGCTQPKMARHSAQKICLFPPSEAQHLAPGIHHITTYLIAISD